MISTASLTHSLQTVECGLAVYNCMVVCWCIVQVNGVTGEMFTFLDVDNAVRRTASGLCRLGVKRGDVVMCFAPNSHDFVFILLAAMCNGAPIAPVNSSYTACESTEVVLPSGWQYRYLREGGYVCIGVS